MDKQLNMLSRDSTLKTLIILRVVDIKNNTFIFHSSSSREFKVE